MKNTTMIFMPTPEPACKLLLGDERRFEINNMIERKERCNKPSENAEALLLRKVFGLPK